MTSALTYKELREVAGIAVLGLAALVLVAAGNMGWSPLPGMFTSMQQGTIPFVSDSFLLNFGLAACGLAMALGFRQSLGDFRGDAQLFLLHRPVSRGRIYGTKLLVGLGVYLICGLTPILLYGWWADLPGTHASPFDWTMTGAAWTAWLAMTAVYLGAFLSGIRPAAWFGTRLAPLAAAGVLAMLAAMLPWTLGLLALVAIDALLLAAILFVVEARDFA